ncbi:MAG TPA: PQQ-binding-like beta-propeller repeat protein, partial [Ktedonobacterales bacterium]
MSAPESAAAGESATAQAKSPTVIVASRYGTLWLLDAATGGLRWRRVTEGRVPTVAQSEQLVYSLSVAKLPTRKTLDGDEPVQADALSRLGGMTMGHWSRLLALRIADGSVAWQREGFAATDRVGFALDGEILVTDGPTPEFGRRFVYGLDAQSGAVRWNFNVGPPHGLTRRLFGASDGRAYVYPEGDEHRLNALDTRTGEIVWSVNHATPFVTLSQPKGALIVVTSQPAPAEPRGESVHAALTGAVANERLPADGLIALGDDGVAYT